MLKRLKLQVSDCFSVLFQFH